jgi:hypothetical protein
MDHQKQLILALKAEIKKRDEIINLQKKLQGRTEFFKYYFDNLPFYQTQTDCFNAVNDLYFELFKEYKYTDYNSFRKQVTTYLKPKK